MVHRFGSRSINVGFQCRRNQMHLMLKPLTGIRIQGLRQFCTQKLGQHAQDNKRRQKRKQDKTVNNGQAIQGPNHAG